MNVFNQTGKMQRESKDIEIRLYEPCYQEVFKSLNEEWINQYFKMEETDNVALNNPKELILDYSRFDLTY